MEGLVARGVDKWKPKSGRGTSTKGKLGDPIADTALLFELGTATIIAPKVSLLGKAAVAIVGIQEGVKAKQAIAKDRAHRALTGNPLDVPVTLQGKEAMAEKIVSSGLAVGTNEFRNPSIRLGLGVAAIGFAVAGAIRGHAAHRENMRAADEIMANFVPTPVDEPAVMPGIEAPATA